MNINTLNTKQQQLKNGFFSIGEGKETILIIGSCRSVPYVQYLHDWELSGTFTINFIDPYNWCYDENDNRINMEEKILSLETDERILNMLKNTDIVIHEWYQNFGMFNFNKEGEKNIYQFGLAPKIDICIPSFNDKFILAADIVSFDMEIRKKVIADYNVIGKLSPQTIQEIISVKENNLDKFLEVCRKSSFPEFEAIFKHNYRNVRYWHNSNHVSKHFTTAIMFLIFGALDVYPSEEFIKYILNSPDMYANIFTPLTEYDEEFKWNEAITPLRNLL